MQQLETKLVVPSGEREGVRGNIGIGEEEVQTIRHKIRYKDIVYNMGEYSQYFVINCK